MPPKVTTDGPADDIFPVLTRPPGRFPGSQLHRTAGTRRV